MSRSSQFGSAISGESTGSGNFGFGTIISEDENEDTNVDMSMYNLVDEGGAGYQANSGADMSNYDLAAGGESAGAAGNGVDMSMYELATGGAGVQLLPTEEQTHRESLSDVDDGGEYPGGFLNFDDFAETAIPEEREVGRGSSSEPVAAVSYDSVETMLVQAATNGIGP